MYGINGSDYPPVSEDTFCKYVLYYEINNSRVRIWDLIILIPNALFVLFLVVRFNKAQLKLRATSSPIFLTFYTLVWGNVIVSLVRCGVSMTVNAAVPLGGLVDKILWVIVILSSPQYPQFLDHSLKIFLKILQEGEPHFIAEYNIQQVRKLILEMIHRLPISETLRPYVKSILILMLKLMEIENEENVLVCLQLFRPP